MDIEKIEALVIEPGEGLVIRVADASFTNQEKLADFAMALDKTLLKGRYVIFSGEVEFSKVKL